MNERNPRDSEEREKGIKIIELGELETDAGYIVFGDAGDICSLESNRPSEAHDSSVIHEQICNMPEGLVTSPFEQFSNQNPPWNGFFIRTGWDGDYPVVMEVKNGKQQIRIATNLEYYEKFLGRNIGRRKIGEIQCGSGVLMFVANALDEVEKPKDTPTTNDITFANIQSRLAINSNATFAKYDVSNLSPEMISAGYGKVANIIAINVDPNKKMSIYHEMCYEPNDDLPVDDEFFQMHLNKDDFIPYAVIELD